MAEHNLVISFEGIGSSGKTTQADLLTENLWKDHNVVMNKIINRELLASALKPFSDKPAEKFWVAYLPEVELGTDLIAFMALYKHRYSQIVSQIQKAPYVIIIERYLYSAFAQAATRIALDQIAKIYKSKSISPETLAEMMLEESKKKNTAFEELVERNASLGLANRRADIENLYKVFVGFKRIIEWPKLTIVLDIPIKDVKSREIRRENRAYTRGDVLYSTVVSKVYRFLARKEPRSVYVIDGSRAKEEISDEILKLVKRKCDLARYKKRVRR